MNEVLESESGAVGERRRKVVVDDWRQHTTRKRVATRGKWSRVRMPNARPVIKAGLCQESLLRLKALEALVKKISHEIS